MIETCSWNLQGASLNMITRLVREGASKQKCIVTYLVLANRLTIIK